METLLTYAGNHGEALKTETEGFVKAIGSRMEEAKDGVDPLIAFEIVTGCASIFFKEGLKIDDAKIKNEVRKPRFRPVISQVFVNKNYRFRSLIWPFKDSPFI